MSILTEIHTDAPCPPNCYGVIYLIENKVNAKKYVGQTIHPEARFSQHLRSKDKTPLISAFKKYGENNFTYTIIDEAADWESLNTLEQHYIEQYKSFIREWGYNLTRGGGGTPGRELDQKEKDVRRESSQNFWNSAGADAEKLRRKERTTGNNNPFFGHSHSTELKKKIGEQKRGNTYNVKSWEIVSPDGDIIVVVNLKKYSLAHGFYPGGLNQVANGVTMSYKGYWCRRFDPLYPLTKKEGHDIAGRIRRHRESHGPQQWEITRPDGTTEYIINLRQYCRDHSLNSGHMSQVAKGTPGYQAHKGYRARKIPHE